jgi:hypothetical protein
MPSMLGCLSEFFETFVFKTGDERPIGLKQFSFEQSNGLTYKQSKQPISALPPVAPGFNQRTLSKAAPAFAYNAPSFGPLDVQDLRKHQKHSSFTGYIQDYSPYKQQSPSHYFK